MLYSERYRAQLMPLSAHVAICIVLLSGGTAAIHAQDASSGEWRKQLGGGATLGTLRRLFLSQKVIVSGAVVDLRGSMLLEWEVAKETSDGRYAATILDHLSSTYKGKSATVIAVQLNELKRRDLRPNALGEIVAEDSIVDPYFDIVVRFDDATLAMLTGYPSTISDDIELASAAGALADEMSKKLPGLIGKTVYAVGYSRLYKPDTSLEDLTDLGPNGTLKQLFVTDVPLLEPLTILAAKYIDSSGVIFKLKLPNGTEALSFTRQSLYKETDSNLPLMEKITGTLLSKIPSFLTPREINAIKRGTIFRGMGKDAVDYLLGFSEKENDYGRGGKQVIYLAGRVIVYLDKDEKVADWQFLDK